MPNFRHAWLPSRGRWFSGIAAALLPLTLACGSAATPAPAPTHTPTAASPIATTTPVSGSVFAPTPTRAAPTATSVPTVAPTKPALAKDAAVVVTEAEPGSVGAWSPGCSAEIHSIGCQDLTVDPLSWIDGGTYQVVPLSAVDSWEQIDPTRWRYTLRPGVKFHNGEELTAEAAKLGLDYDGQANPGTGFTHHGALHGELVPGENLKIDVVCDVACPIFPRAALYTRIPAPKWFSAASEAEKAGNTVSFGPYKIVNYTQGVSTEFERFADYKPNKAFDAQMPTINKITHVYRAESLVRATMLQTGEADWAADLGFDNLNILPQYKISGTTEVYTLVPDLMWHPELKKQKVRLALAMAIDCASLLDSLFGDLIKCWGAIAPPGTVGITEANSRPYTYDPAQARQLLQEAGYDPANAIDVNSRPGSNARGLEILEAVVTMWREVGVNTKLNAWGDLAKAREIQLSGCGRFNNQPGYTEKMDCADRPPPGPELSGTGASSHAYEIATSSEILDLQRMALARMSCFGNSSRVCFPDLERQIQDAISTPEGPERTRKLEAIGDRSHDEVWFFPFFAVQMVYGTGANVDWTPYYQPRLRANTMHFKQ